MTAPKQLDDCSKTAWRQLDNSFVTVKYFRYPRQLNRRPCHSLSHIDLPYDFPTHRGVRPFIDKEKDKSIDIDIDFKYDIDIDIDIDKNIGIDFEPDIDINIDNWHWHRH